MLARFFPAVILHGGSCLRKARQQEGQRQANSRVFPAISHARRITGPEPQPGQQEHRPPRLPIFSAAYAYEIPRDAYALCVPFWPFLPS